MFIDDSHNEVSVSIQDGRGHMYQIVIKHQFAFQFLRADLLMKLSRQVLTQMNAA